MDRFVRVSVVCGAFSAAILAAASAPAQSIGCMRMPSTVAQFFGYGYGHGHHAPIVRTPGVRPERVQRMTLSPSTCGPLGPAPYEMVNCYGGSCPGGCGDGSYLGGPATMPMAVPMMVPDPAAQYVPHLQGPAMGPPMAMQPTAGYVWR